MDRTVGHSSLLSSSSSRECSERADAFFGATTAGTATLGGAGVFGEAGFVAVGAAGLDEAEAEADAVWPGARHFWNNQSINTDLWMDESTHLEELKVLVENINRYGFIKEWEDLSLRPCTSANPRGQARACRNTRRLALRLLEVLLGRNAEINGTLDVSLHEYFRLGEPVEHIQTKREPRSQMAFKSTIKPDLWCDVQLGSRLVLCQRRRARRRACLLRWVPHLNFRNGECRPDIHLPCQREFCNARYTK